MNVRLIILNHTNPENLINIGSVRSEIIGWICRFCKSDTQIHTSKVNFVVSGQKLTKFLHNVGIGKSFALLMCLCRHNSLIRFGMPEQQMKVGKPILLILPLKLAVMATSLEQSQK